MSFRKSDFFVQFRAFYIKEFTRQKKVTNKLFKSVRCVVIAKRGGGVRSARWDSVGCVSMWWYMYIEGYILLLDILRKQASIYVPLKSSFSQKIKIKNPLRGEAVSLSINSFDSFLEEKNQLSFKRCCILPIYNSTGTFVHSGELVIFPK